MSGPKHAALRQATVSAAVVAGVFCVIATGLVA